MPSIFVEDGIKEEGGVKCAGSTNILAVYLATRQDCRRGRSSHLTECRLVGGRAVHLPGFRAEGALVDFADPNIRGAESDTVWATVCLVAGQVDYLPFKTRIDVSLITVAMQSHTGRQPTSTSTGQGKPPLLGGLHYFKVTRAARVHRLVPS